MSSTPEPNSNSMRLNKRNWRESFSDFSNRRQLPAGAMSLFFHLSVLLLLAWFWQPIQRGTGDNGERPVGIAVATSSTAGRDYFLVEATEPSSSSAGESASNADVTGGTQAESPLDVGNLLSGLEAMPGESTGDLNDKTGTLGLGESDVDIGSSNNIPKATTTVFGVTGSGTRFVYVFDRSDSMNGYGGKPLSTAKRELINSLKSLEQVHQFQIVFYNDSPTYFRGTVGNTPKMLYGDATSKQDATAFVRSMFATGGTEHANAIRMALSMGPDVIFFLTDAADPPMKASQLQQISDRAVRNGTTIHCIEFGAGPASGDGGWIKELATETSGQYRYIDVQQLDESNTP